MDIRSALAHGQAQLEQSPTPALDARLLLGHVLGVGAAYLAAHGEQPLTTAQTVHYASLLAAAATGRPVPYLTGTAPFFGREIAVSPAVLIPRPETEELVGAALAWAQAHDPRRVVDVGTGSGCIALTLAAELPAATEIAPISSAPISSAATEIAATEIAATDISAEALELAHANAARHGLDARITFLQGDLLAPLPWKPDLIVANLPYIGDDEWTSLPDGVKWFEPAIALRGGVDGLELVRRLLVQATGALAPQGAIFLEIGWSQGQAAEALARSLFPSAQVAVRADLAGHDRIVVVDTSQEAKPDKRLQTIS